MDRTLLSYLPGFLAQNGLFQILTGAQQSEIDALWDALDFILGEQFIDSASENALQRWEAMLRIPAAGTPEERRGAILLRLREAPPFTLLTLTSSLDTLCGEGRYELTLYYAEYRLKLRIVPTAPFAETRRMLLRMLPANLALDLDYLYMTHQRAGTYRHSELAAWTHQTVREKE